MSQRSQQRSLWLAATLVAAAAGMFFRIYYREKHFTPLVRSGRIVILQGGTNISPDYITLHTRLSLEPALLYIKNPKTGFTKIFQINPSEGRIIDYYIPNHRLLIRPLLGRYYLRLDPSPDQIDLGRDLTGYFPDYSLDLQQDTNRMSFNLPQTTHGWYREFDTVLYYNK